MLKVILSILLLSSTISHAQPFSASQCQTVKKLVDFEFSQTKFSILNRGISQQEIDQHRAKGILMSQLAMEAANQNITAKDYAPKFYQKYCQASS